jgi:hypothetical protein
VKAFVVRRPGAPLTEDDVVQHCAASLTAYKVPTLVEFRDSLPRTEVGKLLRRVLVEQERARQAAAETERPGSVPSSIAARRGAGEAAEEAPVKKAPVKKAPVKKAPVKKAPVKKAPAKKAPAKKAPADRGPATAPPASTEETTRPPRKRTGSGERSEQT